MFIVKVVHGMFHSRENIAILAPFHVYNRIVLEFVPITLEVSVDIITHTPEARLVKV